MKPLGLCVVAAALVLSFTAHSFAQAPMAAPTPAMPEKGEMKGGMKGEMKTSDGMMEKKTDGMKKSDGMEKSDGMDKKSEGMIEKKQP